MTCALAAYRLDRPEFAIAAKVATIQQKQTKPKCSSLQPSSNAHENPSSTPGSYDTRIQALLDPYANSDAHRQATSIVDRWASQNEPIPNDHFVLMIPFHPQPVYNNDNDDAPPYTLAENTHKIHIRRLIEKLDSTRLNLRFLPINTPFPGICVVFPKGQFPSARSVKHFIGSELGCDIEAICAYIRDPEDHSPVANTSIEDAEVVQSPLLTSSEFDCLSDPISLDALDNSLFATILEDSINFETQNERELRIFINELDQLSAQAPAFANRIIDSKSKYYNTTLRRRF